MIGKTNSQTGGFKSELLNISLMTNQPSDADLIGVVVTVSHNGGSKQYVWEGKPLVVSIPPYLDYSVSLSDVNGYKTPELPTYTSVPGNSRTMEGIFQTSVVTFVLDDNQDSYNDVESASVTVSGAVSEVLSNGEAVKIPWGKTIEYSGSVLDGYRTPSGSYTASDASKTIGLLWETELLTVTVGSDGGTPVGYTATVMKEDGTVVGYQTETVKTYKIPSGVRYYVSVSDIEDFTAPEDSPVVTASGGSNAKNSVVMTYLSRPGTLDPDYGVYVQDTEGFYHTASSWTGEYTPNGVAVITSQCRFLIALENASTGTCRWGGTGVSISGVMLTADEATAQTDFDGAGNTDTIISSLDGKNDGYVTGAPAAQYCKSYIFPDGSKGYMGAAGEWQAVDDNLEAVNTALEACGGSTALSGCWTSTQYSSERSWASVLSSGSALANYHRGMNGYARAFASI